MFHSRDTYIFSLCKLLLNILRRKAPSMFDPTSHPPMPRWVTNCCLKLVHRYYNTLFSTDVISCLPSLSRKGRRTGCAVTRHLTSSRWKNSSTWPTYGKPPKTAPHTHFWQRTDQPTCWSSPLCSPHSWWLWWPLLLWTGGGAVLR